MYGHLDKQPEFTGWSDGLEPWLPVLPRREALRPRRRGRWLRAVRLADRGQGAARAGRAARALRDPDRGQRGERQPRPARHIDALGARLGRPSLVVCLDAECGNYDQLWCTTSLRGNLIGTLRVDVLREGVHSGTASGVVPSSFRVLRELLARVEDVHSGAILVDELNTPIPADRRVQAEAAAQVLGETVTAKFPLVPGMQRRCRTTRSNCCSTTPGGRRWA